MRCVKFFPVMAKAHDIPTIVVGNDGSEWLAKNGLNSDCLVHYLSETFQDTELLTVG